MNTMTDSETYNGYANRETWAFNLHWSNDEGLYLETLRVADTDMEMTDYELGEFVVGYWREFIDGYAEETGTPLPEGLKMFDREVGSWWRIDYAEVGASVRESLDAES